MRPITATTNSAPPTPIPAAAPTLSLVPSVDELVPADEDPDEDPAVVSAPPVGSTSVSVPVAVAAGEFC